MTCFSRFLDSCQLTLTWLAHITLNYWQSPDGPVQWKRSFISMLARVTYYCYIHVRVTSPVPQKATGKHFAGPKIFIKLPYPPYSHFFIIIVSTHEYSLKSQLPCCKRRIPGLYFSRTSSIQPPKRQKMTAYVTSKYVCTKTFGHMTVAYSWDKVRQIHHQRRDSTNC